MGSERGGDGVGRLASALAGHLRLKRDEIVSRWLDRIAARVALDPRVVFPTHELLNHMPLLIDGVADYLERPEREMNEEVPVAAKAMELGALRHKQGFDAYEILKEFEILGAIIFDDLRDVVDHIDLDASRGATAECCQRVAYVVEIIRQTTMTHFLRILSERTNEREEQLRRFNRMVSHELKNRVAAIQGAGNLLREPWIDDTHRDRFYHMIVDNAGALQHVLGNLEALSRIRSDARQAHNVLLPQACAEVVRQLREVASSASVDVRVADNLPPVEVDAAGVELCLMNYLSNAIKYADSGKTGRWVEISGEFSPGERSGGDDLVVRVRDNGRGVRPEDRPRLFQQFYRANDETVTEVEGTGLGLSLARETAESLGGHAWAEFPADGTTIFAFSLPSRRQEDAAAAGVRRPEKTTG